MAVAEDSDSTGQHLINILRASVDTPSVPESDTIIAFIIRARAPRRRRPRVPVTHWQGTFRANQAKVKAQKKSRPK